MNHVFTYKLQCFCFSPIPVRESWSKSMLFLGYLLFPPDMSLNLFLPKSKFRFVKSKSCCLSPYTSWLAVVSGLALTDWLRLSWFIVSELGASLICKARCVRQSNNVWFMIDDRVVSQITPLCSCCLVWQTLPDGITSVIGNPNFRGTSLVFSGYANSLMFAVVKFDTF